MITFFLLFNLTVTQFWSFSLYTPPTCMSNKTIKTQVQNFRIFFDLRGVKKLRQCRNCNHCSFKPQIYMLHFLSLCLCHFCAVNFGYLYFQVYNFDISHHEFAPICLFNFRKQNQWLGQQNGKTVCRKSSEETSRGCQHLTREEGQRWETHGERRSVIDHSAPLWYTV